MNQHLAKAIEFYGDDLQQLLAWHLCHGFVLCRSECFAMGFFVNYKNPMSPVLRDGANSLFVTYCAGSMLHCLKEFKNEFQFVVFQRDTKSSPNVRIWDYQKTLNRVK